MARIKGVDIPNDKHICISLTYIYGIGRSLAMTICEKAKVEPTKKAGDLTMEELNALRDQINEHLVEGDLRREVNMNIKTKMEINSYQCIDQIRCIVTHKTCKKRSGLRNTVHAVKSERKRFNAVTDSPTAYNNIE